MPADRKAALARSTADGSPPAITYRTPPMVKNRVATPARIPMSQFRRLATIVGRLFTAIGGIPTDCAAAAGSAAVTITAPARTIVRAITTATPPTLVGGRRRRPDRRPRGGSVAGARLVFARSASSPGPGL